MVSGFSRGLLLGCFAVAGLASTNAGCGECMAECTSGARVTVRVPVPDDDPQRLALRVCVEDRCTDLTYQPDPTHDGGTADAQAEAGADGGDTSQGASEPSGRGCLPYSYRERSGGPVRGSCASRLEDGRLAISIETWSLGPDAVGKDVRLRVEVRDTKTGVTILSKEARDRVEKAGDVCGQECGYAEIGLE